VLQTTVGTGIDWHYVSPGKPTQNAFIESFNSKLRDVTSVDVAEREPLRLARRCHRKDRGVADRRQYHSTAQLDRQPNAGSLRCGKRPRDGEIAKRSNGRDVALPTELRASIRCSTTQTGSNTGPDSTLNRVSSGAQARTLITGLAASYAAKHDLSGEAAEGIAAKIHGDIREETRRNRGRFHQKVENAGARLALIEDTYLAADRDSPDVQRPPRY
jgi:hypothetical protein